VVHPEAQDPIDKALDGENDPIDRRIDEQEVESFPASDPHSDWSGPPA
jgi:hypothetical protein